MQPGIHDGVPLADYLAGPGINKTGLVVFSKSPARFRFGPPNTSRPMALGRLIHTVILEPDEFERRYWTSDLPVFNRDHKAFQKEETQALGRELVKRADVDTAKRVRDSVMSHPVARELLHPGTVKERTFVWHDRATGVLCRGRADATDPRTRVMVDLKSTKDARWSTWRTIANDFRYHWQHAMYSDGMREADGWTPEAFVFLAVEPEPPYLCALFEYGAREVELGRTDVRRTLREYRTCLDRDTWPGHPPVIQSLRLPTHAYSPLHNA